VIYNPFRVIRELERKLDAVELARVKAEDECRNLHALLSVARESESQVRKDWMEYLIHPRQVVERQSPPPPARRPQAHGAALEAAMMAKYEKDLGIDQPN